MRLLACPRALCLIAVLPLISCLPATTNVALGLSGSVSPRAVPALVSLRGGNDVPSTEEPIVYHELKPFMKLDKPYKWVPTPQSRMHDHVNLGALPILGGAALYGLIFGDQRVHRLLTLVGTLYIGLDSLWLFVYPLIVKSPGFVMRHHIATILVLLDPLMTPSHSLYTSACMLVELNTLLLLLRRHTNYSLIVEIPFLITWLLLRVIWYPFLMYYFILCGFPSLRAYYPKALWDLRLRLEGGAPKKMLLPSLVAWILVTIFQLYWTGQLWSTHPWMAKKKAEPATQGGADAKAESVAKGYL